MQHSIKDDYINSLKNYTNQFKDTNFRRIACNDFKSWPGPREETWRLSRLGSLSRKKIKPINPNFKKNNTNTSKLNGSTIIQFIDGAFREDLSSDMPSGVNLSILGDSESLEYLQKIKKSNLSNHPSTNASLSCTPSIMKLTVTKDTKVKDFFEIIYEGGENSQSVHPVLYIELKENSSLYLIERFNHLTSLAMPLQLTELRNKASLNSIKIFNDYKETHNLSANCAYLSEKSNLNSFSLIKGGIFTRSETHAYLNGCGAKLNLNGIYISGNKQHHDLTTAIYHDVSDCTSKQIVRGVLGGKSTGVFQGKVKVAKHAQRTDGQQMSRAILLSDSASANAKPELEIYADDVICAHGATVGELDDDQLFYLNSRGVPMNKAREILIKAFLEDIINQSVDKSLHNFVFKEAELALSSILTKEKSYNETL